MRHLRHQARMTGAEVGLRYDASSSSTSSSTVAGLRGSGGSPMCSCMRTATIAGDTSSWTARIAITCSQRIESVRVLLVLIRDIKSMGACES